MAQLVQAVTPVYNNFSQTLLDSIPKEIDLNKKVTFKLIQRGNQTMILESMSGGSFKREALPTSVSLPLTESILDPGTGAYITLAFFEGAITPSARPKGLAFTRDNSALIEVIPNQDPTKFYRLMFSNFNANGCNPRRRTPQDGYLFEIVHPEKADEDAYDKEEQVDKAKFAVYAAKVDQLKRLAPKIGIAAPEDITEKGLRLAWNNKAKVDPKGVAALLSADVTEIYDLVQTLIEKEQIAYVAEENQYVQLPARKFLVAVPANTVPADTMVAWLIAPANAKTLTALKKAVE